LPINRYLKESVFRATHPILSEKDLTLQHKIENTDSKLEAMKLTHVEAERFEMMFKKRLVSWRVENPSWNVPAGIVAVVKMAQV